VTVASTGSQRHNSQEFEDTTVIVACPVDQANAITTTDEAIDHTVPPIESWFNVDGSILVPLGHPPWIVYKHDFVSNTFMEQRSVAGSSHDLYFFNIPNFDDENLIANLFPNSEYKAKVLVSVPHRHPDTRPRRPFDPEQPLAAGIIPAKGTVYQCSLVPIKYNCKDEAAWKRARALIVWNLVI
jgi:hypothetical protein